MDNSSFPQSWRLQEDYIEAAQKMFVVTKWKQCVFEKQCMEFQTKKANERLFPKAMKF